MDDTARLCALVGEETALCAELAGVLREQQEAIVALAPAPLLACLERRAALAQALLQARAARIDGLRALAHRHGEDPAESPNDALAQLPPEPRARVRAALTRLREMLVHVRHLERQTDYLVEEGLAQVQELVSTLVALVPGTRYGADAGLATPAGIDRLDRRA